MSGAAKKAAKRAQGIQEQAASQAQKSREEALGILREGANIDLPTFLSTDIGREYQDILKNRLAGRGLIDVDSLTSPVANQVRAGLERTKANIGSAASARGLGRSTVATSQIGEASQAAERDIAERMSQLELARQQQIENAVGQYGSLAETEAAGQANRSIFDREGKFSVANFMSNIAEQAKQDQYLIANSIRQEGARRAAQTLQYIQMGLGAGVGLASGLGAFK